MLRLFKRGAAPLERWPEVRSTLAGGFIGGPIFPLLFVGGSAGGIVNLIFPAIPLALSVICMIAAVPGALLPVPHPPGGDSSAWRPPRLVQFLKLDQSGFLFPAPGPVRAGSEGLS